MRRQRAAQTGHFCLSGYFHPSETELYYLQSRYYDPTTCRFINADAYASTGQGILGHNMFAYCGNNPISRVDAGGRFWDLISDLLVDLIETLAPGSKKRANDVMDDPSLYNIVNWLTLGFADTVKGAVAPEKPLSLDHWLDSFAVVSTAFVAFKKITNTYRAPTSSGAYTSRGSTGRTTPLNLKEKLAMEQVMSDPLQNGKKIPIIMTDPKWPASEGWVKMASNVNGVEIHFVYNEILNVFDDFKFK